LHIAGGNSPRGVLRQYVSDQVAKRTLKGGLPVPVITFAWTTPALLAGAKTVIRQPWAERTAAQFHAGTLAVAYDRWPPARAGTRGQGGRPVAIIRLQQDPVREALACIPDADYEAEGWKWLHEHRALLPRWIKENDFSWEAFDRWRARPALVWVVRFELVAAVAVGDQAAEAVVEARAAA
jgi:hypothetical protein